MDKAVDDLGRDVFCLCGMPIDMLDLAQAEASILAAIEYGERCFVSTPNLNFLTACQHDAGFRDSVVHSDLSLADGQPLVWLAKFLGAPLTERVAGSTLFDIMSKGTGVGGRKIAVFFFGGMEGVAEQACLALNESSTGMHCVGYEYPGFGSVEQMSTDAIIERINASGPDFLVVSLGAAKGQDWIMKNQERLAVPVISHLGAVINFVAGSVQRAPRWMQAVGLEWLWRIKEDPVLWRRYLRDGIAVLGLLFTRLLPYRFLLLFDTANHGAAQARLEMRAEGASIALSGSLDKSAINTLRPVFRRGLCVDSDLVLDMGGVTRIDGAALGFLLQFENSMRRQGRRFFIEGASPKIRRALHWNRLDYMLVSACRQGKGDSAHLPVDSGSEHLAAHSARRID